MSGNKTSVQVTELKETHDSAATFPLNVRQVKIQNEKYKIKKRYLEVHQPAESLSHNVNRHLRIAIL